MKKFIFKIRNIYFGKPYLENGVWLSEDWDGNISLVSYYNWGLGIIYGDFEIVRDYDPNNTLHVKMIRSGGNYKCN